MKIAFYIPVLNVGGAEKVIINLLKQLSLNEGDEYFLITDAVHSSWIKEIDSKVTILNVNSEKNIFLRFYNVAKAISVNRIELVVSHLTHSNIHCLLIKFFGLFKLIVVEHNITSTYINDIPKLKLVLKLLIRALFRKADQIICVSQASKDDLVGFFSIPENKCKVIYNPFDFKQIKELSISAITDELLNKINNRKFIVTVSRLEIQKNHIFLIDSLSDYLKSKDIVLVLVGGGSQKNSIETKIAELDLKNNVFLTGNISNPYRYIVNANVLVHPARFEGFGLVLIEAIYLETQVISMNFETAFEVLENGRLGSIVQDKLSLIEAIDIKLNSSNENLKMKFKNEVYEKYNLEIISNHYHNFFKSLY